MPEESLLDVSPLDVPPPLPLTPPPKVISSSPPDFPSTTPPKLPPTSSVQTTPPPPPPLPPLSPSEKVLPPPTPTLSYPSQPAVNEEKTQSLKQIHDGIKLEINTNGSFGDKINDNNVTNSCIPKEDLVQSQSIKLEPAKNIINKEENKSAANSIAENSITTNSVAKNSAAANSVATNSGVANSVAANSVAANSVAENSAAASLVVVDSVTINPAAANSVAANSVATNSVAANSVATNSDVANSNVANSITTNSITESSAATNSAATNSVAVNSVAKNSVTTDPVVTNSVAASSVVVNSVMTNPVVVNSVTMNPVLVNSVTTNSVAENSVTENLVLETVKVNDDKPALKHQLNAGNNLESTATNHQHLEPKMTQPKNKDSIKESDSNKIKQRGNNYGISQTLAKYKGPRIVLNLENLNKFAKLQNESLKTKTSPLQRPKSASPTVKPIDKNSNHVHSMISFYNKLSNKQNHNELIRPKSIANFNHFANSEPSINSSNKLNNDKTFIVNGVDDNNNKGVVDKNLESGHNKTSFVSENVKKSLESGHGHTEQSFESENKSSPAFKE